MKLEPEDSSHRLFTDQVVGYMQTENYDIREVSQKSAQYVNLLKKIIHSIYRYYGNCLELPEIEALIATGGG